MKAIRMRQIFITKDSMVSFFAAAILIFTVCGMIYSVYNTYNEYYPDNPHNYDTVCLEQQTDNKNLMPGYVFLSAKCLDSHTSMNFFGVNVNL
jgi:hypothetical protein